MRTTNSKKQRIQKVREGHLDPEISRLDWSGISPITRKTPTKQEKIDKDYKKYRRR